MCSDTLKQPLIEDMFALKKQSLKKNNKYQYIKYRSIDLVDDCSISSGFSTIIYLEKMPVATINQ